MLPVLHPKSKCFSRRLDKISSLLTSLRRRSRTLEKLRSLRTTAPLILKRICRPSRSPWVWQSYRKMKETPTVAASSSKISREQRSSGFPTLGEISSEVSVNSLRNFSNNTLCSYIEKLLTSISGALPRRRHSGTCQNSESG